MEGIKYRNKYIKYDCNPGIDLHGAACESGNSHATDATVNVLKNS